MASRVAYADGTVEIKRRTVQDLRLSAILICVVSFGIQCYAGGIYARGANAAVRRHRVSIGLDSGFDPGIAATPLNLRRPAARAAAPRPARGGGRLDAPVVRGFGSPKPLGWKSHPLRIPSFLLVTPFDRCLKIFVEVQRIASLCNADDNFFPLQVSHQLALPI